MQDIIPYKQLRRRAQLHAQAYHVRPLSTQRLMKVSRDGTSIEVIETKSFVVEPAPMTRPIESLSAEEKIRALERALRRARQSARAERKGRRRILISQAR